MHWDKTNRGSRLGWAHHSGLESRESLGVIGDLREWEQRVHMSLAGGHRVEALGQKKGTPLAGAEQGVGCGEGR